MNDLTTVYKKMPSKWRVRRVFRPLVLGIARGLARAGMSPNGATGLVMLLSFAVFFYELLLPLPVTWLTGLGFALLVFVTGIMDGVDGAIARQTGKQSKFGGVLDSTVDRVSDALVFCAPAFRDLLARDVVNGQLVWLPGLDFIPLWFWSIILVIGAYLTSYVRARTTLADATVDTDVGALARSERLLCVVIGTACGVQWMTIIFLAIFTNVTAIYRLNAARNGLTLKNE